MKNLLVEGLPGCGKSTAISDALRSLGLLPFCAGFRTARVFSSGGEHLGFAQFPASADIGVSIISDETLPHMIMDFRMQQGLISEIFTGFTVDSLKSIPAETAPTDKAVSPERNSGAGTEIRLILMDEIGGAELEIPEVQDAFLNALKGNIPCIGVLKSREHAKKFAYESYTAFRKQIERETETELLLMTEANRWEARQRIVRWLLQL